ncbi:DoxX family membrane protein [Erythrobacter colymbi]|uniref:DoxX family membrane protein n=1 Tax=Erythrobacter colymbi TaxID=1161202 RepID=UPI000A3B4706|nr:DoxX family protein [Erythrobacter colymbi]
MHNVRFAAPAGRLLLSLIFLLSGVSKATDPTGTMAYIAAVIGIDPLLPYIGSTVIELLFGLLLLAGYRTRMAAAVLSAFAVAAALLFHSDLADQNQMIHFLKNIAIAGGLLQIVAFGPGALSLDARRTASRAAA